VRGVAMVSTPASIVGMSESVFRTENGCIRY